MRIALTEQEVQALYAQCVTALDRALLGLYYGCGLRRQEGLDLDLQDVDMLNERLTVRQGKFAKRREIPFPSRIALDLGTYLRNERPLRVHLHEPDGRRAFLLNTQGRRLSGTLANKRVQEMAREAGITEVVSLLQGEGFPVSQLWLSKAEVETE